MVSNILSTIDFILNHYLHISKHYTLANGYKTEFIDNQ